MNCRHCGQDIVSVYSGAPPGADGLHPREWVHTKFGRPECWIQTAVLPAGADPEDKAQPIEGVSK